ncbi:DUF4307 domain-containing protein [Cellulomonas denverensis]|uniref:DUF4307 domain-containing protein n=1 Tax=Cellulomonas denverensis TaxID=264297 RepID=UPI0035EAD1F5
MTTASPPACRYGPPQSPQRRRAARIGIAILAAIGLGIVIWIGLGAAGTAVRWNDVGYRVDGSTAVEITFDVIQDPGEVAVCRVQALSASHAEVGVQQITVGPSQERTTRVTATIPTAEAAVTAAVHGCEPA